MNRKNVVDNSESKSPAMDPVIDASKQQAMPRKRAAKPGLFKMLNRNPLFMPSLVLLVALVASWAYIIGGGALSKVSVPAELASLSAAEQVEVRDNVVAALSDLMILPDGSDPVIASVDDSDTLKAQQPFYENVEEGDVLAIFETSRQAVIYRPSEHIIVNAGSLIYDPGESN